MDNDVLLNEAELIICINEQDALQFKNDANIIEVNSPSFWYLHGDIQKLANTDKALMFVNKNKLRKAQLYSCSNNKTNELITYVEGSCIPCVIINNENYFDGYAYLWKQLLDKLKYTLLTQDTQRGLVCLANDYDAIKHAELMYAIKPTFM